MYKDMCIYNGNVDKITTYNYIYTYIPISMENVYMVVDKAKCNDTSESSTRAQ